MRGGFCVGIGGGRSDDGEAGFGVEGDVGDSGLFCAPGGGFAGADEAGVVFEVGVRS